MADVAETSRPRAYLISPATLQVTTRFVRIMKGKNMADLTERNLIGPARVQPPTLMHIAACFIVECTLDGRPNVLRCLVDVPPTILDFITPLYIRKCYEINWTKDDGTDDRLAVQKKTVPRAIALLRSFVMPHLSRLDLEMLVGMGKRERHLHVSYLVIHLPRMIHLVSLSLKRSTPKTLPVNMSHFLDMVGRHCPKLRSLDLSSNNKVTREGLLRLSPHYGDGRVGCPLLQDLLLYDCNVPELDLPLVLRDMPQLRHLGHMETGQIVKIVYTSQMHSNTLRPTRLTYINNVGRWSCYGGVRELGFDLELANVLTAMCPYLQHLMVRLEEQDAEHLCRYRLKSLKVILASATTLHTPGPHLTRYMLASGVSLTTLALLCGSFQCDFFQVLGVGCPNLRNMWIVCDILRGDGRMFSDFPIFTRLSSLLLKVDERCQLPVMLMLYLTQNSQGLEDISLAVNTPDIDEAWIDVFVSYVNTSELKWLKITPGPFGERFDMTMDTVFLLSVVCPQLEILGDVVHWRCCRKLVHRYQRQLRQTNCSLRLVFQEEEPAAQQPMDRIFFADPEYQYFR